MLFCGCKGNDIFFKYQKNLEFFVVFLHEIIIFVAKYSQAMIYGR